MSAGTAPADVDLSAMERGEWTRAIGAVAAELGMESAPVVDFDCAPKMNGGARYDSVRDVMTVMGGWVAASPDPQSLASRALIAHELGHRLDRVRMRRACRTLMAAMIVLCLVAAGAVLGAFAEAITESGGGALAAPLWVGLVPAAVAPVMVLLSAVCSWPGEYRADTVAASVFGAPGVHAFLDVFDRTDGGWPGWLPGHTHPSRRMRRARHPM